MMTPEEREAMIQELLEGTSLWRDEAEEVVAMYLGESEGDVVGTRPLSREERRRLGLDLTIEEAQARMRQRAAALERTPA